MNRRDAKREAYFHAAMMLRNILAGGWTASDDPRYTAADAERIDDALREVVDGLANRGAIYEPPDVLRESSWGTFRK